jgi:hypothetical protein
LHWIFEIYFNKKYVMDAKTVDGKMGSRKLKLKLIKVTK